jgi:hypothetical protein
VVEEEGDFCQVFLDNVRHPRRETRTTTVLPRKIIRIFCPARMLLEFRSPSAVTYTRHLQKSKIPDLRVVRGWQRTGQSRSLQVPETTFFAFLVPIHL